MATSKTRSNVDSKITCTDFALFQETLKTLRKVDDRVVHALNCSIPTDSFQKHNDPTQACKQLFQQLQDVHAQRDQMIRKCVKEMSHSLETTMQSSQATTEAPEKRHNLINLKHQQRKLRQMQQELNVEEIIKDRSLKAYHERCRSLYDPTTTAATS